MSEDGLAHSPDAQRSIRHHVRNLAFWLAGWLPAEESIGRKVAIADQYAGAFDHRNLATL